MTPDLKLAMYHNILSIIKTMTPDNAASQITNLFEIYIKENTKPLDQEDLLDSEMTSTKKGSFRRIK